MIWRNYVTVTLYNSYSCALFGDEVYGESESCIIKQRQSKEKTKRRPRRVCALSGGDRDSLKSWSTTSIDASVPTARSRAWSPECPDRPPRGPRLSERAGSFRWSSFETTGNLGRGRRWRRMGETVRRWRQWLTRRRYHSISNSTCTIFLLAYAWCVHWWQRKFSMNVN